MVTDVTANNRKIKWQELARTQDPEFVRNVIARETRNWGFSLLLLGVVQLVASNFLNPVWGVAVILIGAASFYFRSAAMLPVYGVTLAWAMVSNVLTGQVQWIIFALFQAYWALCTFQQFMILRRATSRLGIGLGIDSPVWTDRAAGVFPWVGCALSAAAPIGLVALIFVIGLSSEFTGQEMSEQTVGLAFMALTDSACLGLALGLAALLARFRWRLVSILAVIAGGLMLGFFSLLMLLS